MTIDPQTRTWWNVLRGVSLLNFGLCAAVAVTIDLSAPYRTAHLVLCTIYTLVCAFRSFYPRVDLERTVMVDHWLSSIVIGRSSATIAEMCFTIQLSLVFVELSSTAPLLAPIGISFIPIIVLAQTACWYGVLSGNHLWHAVEEILWTLTVVLLAVGGILLWPSADGIYPALIVVGWISCAFTAYVMSGLDVPMYFTRYRAEKAAGREFLSAAAGFQDALTRREPTGAWKVWQHEVAWMTPYFSAGVWLSLFLARFSP